MKLTKFEFALK